MFNNSLQLTTSPIQFGTDGWRGVLGVDITLDRLLPVAIAATQELVYRAPNGLNQEVIIGYDRRFMAAEFAEAISSAVRGCNLEPVLADSAVTTPACSWAVVERKALGALVVTASHNPPEWLGLKIKGPWGGSVESDFTKAVERRLLAGGITVPLVGENKTFDCRKEHLLALKKKFDMPLLVKKLNKMGITVFVDSMHGSAAGCLADLIGAHSNEIVKEIRTERDPLFGGNPPEPLAKNLHTLISTINSFCMKGEVAMGIVFDGDGDRIAAVDERGRFCSTQLLIPLLIEHLASVRKLPGCVIKTVSGSDLMTLVAEELGRDVLEMPVGFKYIASEMLQKQVLLGGEESGGIGFGEHLPERDALYAALVLLETIANSGKTLAVLLDDLKIRFGECHYDRIDLRLPDMNTRERFEKLLRESPPSMVGNELVQEILQIDGFKLRMNQRHWLMFRFSGTEPLLRIYCEAQSKEQLTLALQWAQKFAENI